MVIMKNRLTYVLEISTATNIIRISVNTDKQKIVLRKKITLALFIIQLNPVRTTIVNVPISQLYNTQNYLTTLVFSPTRHTVICMLNQFRKIHNRESIIVDQRIPKHLDKPGFDKLVHQREAFFRIILQLTDPIQFFRNPLLLGKRWERYLLIKIQRHLEILNPCSLVIH